MYPTRLRDTRDSFALNLDARILGPVAALLTTQLVKVMPVSGAAALAYSAAAVAALAYSTSFIGSFWLHEAAGTSIAGLNPGCASASADGCPANLKLSAQILSFSFFDDPPRT